MKQTTLSRCGFLTALALIGSLQAAKADANPPNDATKPRLGGICNP